MAKEERTEYVHLAVTPTTKKEFDMARGNKELEEKIIRDFITVEEDWMKGEIQDIDDITVLYRAKLLTIKDNFYKAHESYIESIEGIYDDARGRLSKLDSIADGLNEKVDAVHKKMKEIEKASISTYTGQLEKFIELMDQFEKMDDTTKEFLSMFIKSKLS